MTPFGPSNLGVRGLVYDENGELTSNFKVDVIDEKVKFSKPNGNPDGSFHIVLNPGDYD